jgi:hypothetical protein
MTAPSGLEFKDMPKNIRTMPCIGVSIQLLTGITSKQCGRVAGRVGRTGYDNSFALVGRKNIAKSGRWTVNVCLTLRDKYVGLACAACCCRRLSMGVCLAGADWIGRVGGTAGFGVRLSGLWSRRKVGGQANISADAHAEQN